MYVRVTNGQRPGELSNFRSHVKSVNSVQRHCNFVFMDRDDHGVGDPFEKRKTTLTTLERSRNRFALLLQLLIPRL